MKKIILLIVIIINCQLSIVTSFAQAPTAIPYQAVARNSAGNPIANQTIKLKISLCPTGSCTTPLYVETHTVTTNSLGLFTINIGQGSVDPGNPLYEGVEWGDNPMFGNVKMDATGGNTFVDMGTTQMMSVPYALYAKIAGSTPGAVVFKGVWNASTNSPNLNDPANAQKGNIFVVTNVGGSTTGTVNFTLDGISDWEIGDWAIYNGTIWQKVDNSGSGAMVYKGTWDAVANVPDLNNPANAQRGNTFTVSNIGSQTSGSVNFTLSGINDWHIGDWAIFNGSVWQKVDNSNAPVSASNVTFTPTTTITATNVQGALEELNTDMRDSYIHKLDDGVTIYSSPDGSAKRFGIGDTAPAAPLGITASGTNHTAIHLQTNQLSGPLPVMMSLSGNGNNGFNIENETSTGNVSRMFIQETTGNIGLGTTNPTEKLHIEESTTAGLTGLHIRNTASSANEGWKLGHLDDNSIAGRSGAFSILEKNYDPVAPSSERLTIRAGGNVGINELIPDTKLHVSRPVSDPQSTLDLVEGTGIATFGPMTDNLVFDYRGIQARTGTYSGSTLSLTAADLNLQPLGGNIIIHGSSASISDKIIMFGGKLGLGTLTPAEKIEIDGAIKIGTTANNNDGTIRYTGTDFEGRKAGNWVSLTGGYPSTPITPADGSTVNPTTYDPSVAELITNMRQRINDLEAVLINHGLLIPHP